MKDLRYNTLLRYIYCFCLESLYLISCLLLKSILLQGRIRSFFWNKCSCCKYVPKIFKTLPRNINLMETIDKICQNDVICQIDKFCQFGGNFSTNLESAIVERTPFISISCKFHENKKYGFCQFLKIVLLLG